jgi:glycosyltransferase involved in cell wall biosynthesis
MSNASNRAVLLIVYEFPPAGGPGVQRVLKFAKYLPQFGWRPIIVTTTPETYAVRDNTLFGDIPPGTPIYRVRTGDIRRLRPLAERFKLGTPLSAANAALMLPDAAMFWARWARAAVAQTMSDHQPAVLFSSSPPGSAHLLGLWARRTYGLPWVADFRDPWSQDRLYPYYPGYRALNRRLERQVLSNASRVVTVSSTLAELLGQLASDVQSKVSVIENGYDEQDVVVLAPPQTARFTISYTGEFSRIRHPDAFVSAIDGLVDSGQIPVQDLRIAFAGKNTAKFIPGRPPFEQLGYLSHGELNALRRDSDLLLLIQGDSPTAPAKLFEYMGCNRPTLAVTNPGNVAARLIERTNAGIATSHDPAEIAAAVLHYYALWKGREFDYTPDWDFIHTFTRRNQTGLLAHELDRLYAAG